MARERTTYHHRNADAQLAYDKYFEDVKASDEFIDSDLERQVENIKKLEFLNRTTIMTEVVQQDFRQAKKGRESTPFSSSPPRRPPALLL